MNKPSRSEIEQSLLGSRAESQARIDRATTIPPREEVKRQKTIIGGNLEGVSRKVPKKNYWHWFAAAALVILSGLVFIIPEFFNDAPKISQQQNQASENALYQNRIDESNPNQNSLDGDTANIGDQPPLAENGFTIPNDRDRVAEFREAELEQQQLNELKQKALDAINSGNYTKPANASALTYYQEMLAIDGNNVAATDGINAMLKSLKNTGMEQIEQNNLDVARQTLQTISEIDVDSEEYFDVSEAIENTELAAEQEEIELKIEELTEKAKAALEKDRLVSPESDNVALYLNQILEIDPDNKNARDGIDQMSKEYAEDAEQHILDRDWTSAEENITNLKRIDKDSVLADFLSNRLEKAKQEPEPEPETIVADTDSPTETIQTVPEQDQEQVLAPADELSVAANAIPQNTTVFPAPVSDATQSQKEAELEKQLAAKNAEAQQLKTGLRAYYSGEYVTAYSNLAPLAEKNNTRALVRIGYMYQFGRGVTQNQSLGEQYLRSALPKLTALANSNEAWAQSDLGSLYEDGLVVQQNNNTAIDWYRKAAAQNYAGAQTNLGNMYFFGKGVEQDTEEAIRWYRLAALEGDAIAKQNLIQLGVSSL